MKIVCGPDRDLTTYIEQKVSQYEVKHIKLITFGIYIYTI